MIILRVHRHAWRWVLVWIKQPLQTTSLLAGAEPALEFHGLETLNDEQMFHHIMAVRHGLMSGEMPEEILQEMIEDLMNALVHLASLYLHRVLYGCLVWKET